MNMIFQEVRKNLNCSKLTLELAAYSLVDPSYLDFVGLSAALTEEIRRIKLWFNEIPDPERKALAWELVLSYL